MPRLTDQEKADILRFLEADKPLPDHYRFLLFDDKREVELVWNGKTADVTTVVLPFQTIEHVDEPRIEGKSKVDEELAGGLFDSRGRQMKGCTNKLSWGDNKLILSSLKNGPLRDEIEKQGGLKLIYIDPPFDVGADFSMDIEVGDGGDTFTKRPNILEEIAYRDKGADSFISMIYERLILMRDLLAEDAASIFTWDRTSGIRYARAVMEELFGRERFERELVWQRVSARSHGTFYPATYDVILFARKGDNAIWNQQYTAVSDELVASHYTNVEPGTGRKYTLDNRLNQNKDRPNLRYEVGGHVRTWRWTKDKMEQMIKEGRVVITSSGMPRFKRYLDESKGIPLPGAHRRGRSNDFRMG